MQCDTILYFERMKCFAFLMGVVLLAASCSDQGHSDQPNIIYILADDLGYGELGCYGQELIETPHLDALAAGGMRFTDHYSGAPVCAPARCILLTGMHAGHAFVRGNDEWGARGKVWDYQAMFDNSDLEGQRPMPDSITTSAEYLQAAGYRTGMVGKWGLGAPNTESIPNRQGFDYFLGYNCQRQAHTLYPMHLWENEERRILNNKFVPLHANLQEGADVNDPASYADFQLKDYAPTVMHEGALEFIGAERDEPFFLYYASPIPHVPLQAPQKWVDYYREKFGPEEPFTGTSYFPNLTPRATYAAMISYLDEQVGEMVAKLKELNLYQNTLIIFSSDNGPTYTGGTDTPHFNSARPFKTEYGWGKGFVHEGGIRVPMIASWPAQIKPGSETNHISSFCDVLPTLVEAAGGEGAGHVDGISFLPTLLGETQAPHDYLYWEFPAYQGQQAVRKGKWKGIRKDIFKGNMDIELYDLAKDRREQNNIAADYPDVVAEMEAIMRAARTEPSIDRFKMEQLGDVKIENVEARNRLASLDQSRVAILKDLKAHFRISKNTSLREAKNAERAIASLQALFENTGDYRLNSVPDNQKNQIRFIQDVNLAKQIFKMEITSDAIIIKAGSAAGFSNAVATLIGLIDEKITDDHIMHNPTWLVAAAELKAI